MANGNQNNDAENYLTLHHLTDHHYLYRRSKTHCFYEKHSKFF